MESLNNYGFEGTEFHAEIISLEEHASRRKNKLNYTIVALVITDVALFLTLIL